MVTDMRMQKILHASVTIPGLDVICSSETDSPKKKEENYCTYLWIKTNKNIYFKSLARTTTTKKKPFSYKKKKKKRKKRKIIKWT